MGFSLVAEGLLLAHLPDREWSPLVSKLGYGLGFLVVILGRQQLSAENTLTVIIPLLHGESLETLMHVARLWVTILIANLLATLVFAVIVAKSGVFPDPVKAVFAAIRLEALSDQFGATLLKGIFAGWLIALMG
jgi:formate-nitrite transporter family protein